MSQPRKRLRTAVLISGRGSNMLALLQAARAEDYPADILLVISNRPNAGGLALAREHDVAAIAIDHKAYASRKDFECEMDAALRDAKIELIACAGFMRVLSPWFVRRWAKRMVNIHPSLLPKYKGLNTHARALEAGDAQAGCTVHWVSEGVDDGEIISQASVPIAAGDTVETLSARVQTAEHVLYPEALAKAAKHILAMEAGNV